MCTGLGRAGRSPSPSGALALAVSPATAGQGGSRARNRQDVRCTGYHRHNTTRVRLFRRERRLREQTVPVVLAVRAGAVRAALVTVRAALVTTSMWQRGGCKGAPVRKPLTGAHLAVGDGRRTWAHT